MKEELVRPQALFDTYLKLAEDDVALFFKNAAFRQVPCPACSGTTTQFLFRKMGFDYEECTTCRTLFVNPRPDNSAFEEYYTKSASVEFWATNFYKETEDARRKEIIRPKAHLVKEYIEKYGERQPGIAAVIDIGAGYGVFCEELKQIAGNEFTVLGIEPAPALQQICKEKGICIIPKFLDEVTVSDLEGYAVTAAISFELVEHLHDPQSFIRHCSRIMSRGSLLILTTLNWHGFDLQVLREHSKSIHPPHHINFFTPQSLSLLLEHNGFSICDIQTPGKLDVDIVRKQPDDVSDPFINKILTADEATREKFQVFLQDAHMSSHMMIVARRS